MYIQADVDLWPECEYYHDSDDGPLDRAGIQDEEYDRTGGALNLNKCGYAKRALPFVTFLAFAAARAHAVRFTVSQCKTELFYDYDPVKNHLEKHPDAKLKFCSYGYYTMQQYTCKTLTSGSH